MSQVVTVGNLRSFQSDGRTGRLNSASAAPVLASKRRSICALFLAPRLFADRVFIASRVVCAGNLTASIDPEDKVGADADTTKPGRNWIDF